MKKINKKSSPESGLTMIELLIYVAVFALVLSLMIQILSGTFGIFARVRSTRGLTTAGSSILERMTYNIRHANAFSATGNNLNISPGSLSIEVPNSSGGVDTYVYSIQSNRITENKNNAGANYLNGGGQTVTNFTVDQITAGNINGVVITLTLTDNRISPAQSATFQTTALMRGNY